MDDTTYNLGKKKKKAMALELQVVYILEWWGFALISTLIKFNTTQHHKPKNFIKKPYYKTLKNPHFCLFFGSVLK